MEPEKESPQQLMDKWRPAEVATAEGCTVAKPSCQTGLTPQSTVFLPLAC